MPFGNDVLQYFENQGSGALQGLNNLNSSFSGLQNAGDVRAKYGIRDVGSIYDPFFKTLAANKSRQMQSAVTRSGRSASPEMTYSNIEGNYENSLQNLLGNKGQAEISQDQQVANLLQNAFASKDQFGLSKFNSILSGSRGLFNDTLAKQHQEHTDRDPTFFDKFMTFLGQGAKTAGSLAGLPTGGGGFDFGGGGGGGEWQAGDNWNPGFNIPKPR